MIYCSRRLFRRTPQPLKVLASMADLCMIEYFYVLVLLGSFVVRSVETGGGKFRQQADAILEDNDFAEFEDEHEAESIDETGGLPTKQKSGVGGGWPAAGEGDGGLGGDKHKSVDEDEEEFEIEDETKTGAKFGGATGKKSGAIMEDDDLGDDAIVEEEEEEEGDGEEFFDDEQFEDGRVFVKDGNKKGASQKAGGKAGQQQKETGGVPNLRFADVPAHLRNNWTNYQVELLFLFGLAVYVLNYVYGKARNQSLAQAWLDAHGDILEQQFALVGDDGSNVTTSGTGTDGGHLMRETDADYALWCSGRAGCIGLLVRLHLLHRQDVITLVSQIMRPKRDRVILRVELEPNEMDSFVLVIGNRKSVFKLAKDSIDVNTFCSERKATVKKLSLPSTFALFAEIAESAPAVFDHRVVNMIAKFEDYIDYIHISDQFCGLKTADANDDGQNQRLAEERSRVVMFSLNLPKYSSDVANCRPLLLMLFHCVDKIRRYRLSREVDVPRCDSVILSSATFGQTKVPVQGKQKADKNRAAAAESLLKTTHQHRQEAAQQRREDKARERKQRLMDEEDPEKQRRLEKQEQKRDAKKNQPRMKQLKIKQM